MNVADELLLLVFRLQAKALLYNITDEVQVAVSNQEFKIHTPTFK